jgi:DNA invertase Pin-like site-specific DNA recombinase
VLDAVLVLVSLQDLSAIVRYVAMGRSLELVGSLEKQGIHFRSITDQIDTSTPMGRFFFHIMASLAQMESELLLERTRAGLDAAKLRGRSGGRPRKMTEGKIEAAHKLLESMTYEEVSEHLGVALKTLYQWVPASDLK